MVSRIATDWHDTPPRRVAVFRALALGDLLCAVPTLRALRTAWPAAEITLIGLPWAREFAARFTKYVDAFVEFPGYPGLPERAPHVERVPGFLMEMQTLEFDLAIQLHGSGTIVNSLVALFGARWMAGFYPPGYYRPDPATFAPWPEHGLEIHRLLSLVDYLHLKRAGDDLELPLEATDFERVSELLTAARRQPGPYIVVHPGASVAARRWSAEQFAVVADRLAEAGHEVILTGVASERPIVQAVCAAMRHPAVDLCGQTDLGTLGALVKSAALVLCNDTGISHVAAAVHTPSVVISTGDNPARWAPINRRLHRVLCRAEGVTVEEAYRAAESLLTKHSTPAELATA